MARRFSPSARATLSEMSLALEPLLRAQAAAACSILLGRCTPAPGGGALRATQAAGSSFAEPRPPPAGPPPAAPSRAGLRIPHRRSAHTVSRPAGPAHTPAGAPSGNQVGPRLHHFLVAFAARPRRQGGPLLSWGPLRAQFQVVQRHARSPSAAVSPLWRTSSLLSSPGLCGDGIRSSWQQRVHWGVAQGAACEDEESSGAVAGGAPISGTGGASGASGGGVGAAGGLRVGGGAVTGGGGGAAGMTVCAGASSGGGSSIGRDGSEVGAMTGADGVTAGLTVDYVGMLSTFVSGTKGALLAALFLRPTASTFAPTRLAPRTHAVRRGQVQVSARLGSRRSVPYVRGDRR